MIAEEMTPCCMRCGSAVKRTRLYATGWRRFCSRTCSGKALSPKETGYATRFPPGHVAHNRLSDNHTRVSPSGYRKIRVPQTRSSNGFAHEHSVIAEQTLGRRLRKGEEVHHIDGDKSNNQRSNLLICTTSYHRALERRMATMYQQMMFAAKPDTTTGI